MDLLRAKIYLDKINREFNRMLKDPENVPRIDVDITLSYLREMYDAMLSEDVMPVAPARIAPAAAPKVEIPAPKADPPAPKTAPPVVVEPVAVPAPPPVIVEPVAKPAPPPPVAAAPPPVEVAPVPPAPAPPPEPVIAKAAPEPPAQASAPPQEAGDEEALFEYKEARELSEKLSETPISDIKRAIALNDRLLLQRELFGNDHGAFEAVLNTINGFSGFEQAKSYLLREVITRYDWMHKSRIETAKSFIRLVRRRYK